MDILTPPFNFIVEKDYPGRTLIYTTTGVHSRYGEDFGEDLTWVPMGTVLGALLQRDGQWRIFHPTGVPMGTVESRFAAAEGLLKLYVQQHRPQVVVPLNEESANCPLQQAS